MKNPSSKLTRMRLDLEEYNFTVVYLRGKENVVADALSRISIDDLMEMGKNVSNILKISTKSAKRTDLEKKSLDQQK